MTVEDILKAAPPVIAAVVAFVRILPTATQALQKRRARAVTDGDVVISEYVAPYPWSEKLHHRLTGKAGDTRLRHRSIAVVVSLLVLAIAIEIGYCVIALRLGLPVWSVIVSFVVFLVVAFALAAVLIRLARNADQLTGAAPQSGSVVVEGQRLSAVAQQLLAAATTLGMRVITFDGTVLCAATGVQLSARLFIGEFVKAELRNCERHCVEVVVESIKLDYVTPSRSRRNVLSLLESFLPISKGAGEDRSPAKPATPEASNDDQTE